MYHPSQRGGKQQQEKQAGRRGSERAILTLPTNQQQLGSTCCAPKSGPKSRCVSNPQQTHKIYLAPSNKHKQTNERQASKPNETNKQTKHALLKQYAVCAQSRLKLLRQSTTHKASHAQDTIFSSHPRTPRTPRTATQTKPNQTKRYDMSTYQATSSEQREEKNEKPKTRKPID